MSQIMPAPSAAPVIIATITIASSEMVSTSLHAGTTTTPHPAEQSHRLRGTRCSGYPLLFNCNGSQQRVTSNRSKCRGSGNGKVSVEGERKGDYRSELIARQVATGREEGSSGRGVNPPTPFHFRSRDILTCC